jgi:hypothetical protein
MIGGAFKYGTNSYVSGANHGTIAINAIVGAINNGLYGLSAGINITKIDSLLCLVAEPLDAVTGAVLRAGELKFSDIESGLFAGAVMYISENLFLEPVGHLIDAN